MKFEYSYRISYVNGKICDNKVTLVVDVAKEQYKKIVLEMMSGKAFFDIQGIDDDIKCKIIKDIEFVDRFTNLDGTMRKTAPKKCCAYTDIEVYIPDREYKRLKSIKNLEEFLSRPEEHMTIHRSDGSYISICVENGLVKFRDSKDGHQTTIREADDYIRLITGERKYSIF